MDITFLTETAYSGETSGATPTQDLGANCGPLRVLLSVTALGNTATHGHRAAQTILAVSLEDSYDGLEWRTVHTFAYHGSPHGALGVGEQRAIIGAFQRYVRARFHLRSLNGAGAPTATVAITGTAPTAATEE